MGEDYSDMIIRPAAKRPIIKPDTPLIEHAYYFVGLQSGFVLSLQTGETLGYTVRIN